MPDMRLRAQRPKPGKATITEINTAIDLTAGLGSGKVTDMTTTTAPTNDLFDGSAYTVALGESLTLPNGKRVEVVRFDNATGRGRAYSNRTGASWEFVLSGRMLRSEGARDFVAVRMAPVTWECGRNELGEPAMVETFDFATGFGGSTATVALRRR